MKEERGGRSEGMGKEWVSSYNVAVLCRNQKLFCHVSISSLCPKHCVTELPYMVGLMPAM